MEINSNFINFYQQTPFLLCFFAFFYILLSVFFNICIQTHRLRYGLWQS